MPICKWKHELSWDSRLTNIPKRFREQILMQRYLLNNAISNVWWHKKVSSIQINKYRGPPQKSCYEFIIKEIDYQIRQVSLWLVVSGAISALGWILHVQFYFINEESGYKDINYFKNDEEPGQKISKNSFRKVNPHQMNISRIAS